MMSASVPGPALLGLIYIPYLPLFLLVALAVAFLRRVSRSGPGDGRIRVLLVSPCPGMYGGMEAFVFAVAKHLARTPGFEVRILFKMTRNFELQPALRRICRESPVPVIFATRAGGRLFKWIWWADVVHGQNTSPDVILYARLLGKKLALTIHNWHRRTWGIHSTAWRLVMRLADRRWYNSTFVWETWEPGRRLAGSSCIPTVSDLPTGTVDPAARKGFVFAGRWIANKGLEELVRAYAAARLDRKEWPLRMMGTGPLREPVEALIRETGVEGIELLGFVPDDRKAEVIRHAKWMVVPPNTKEDLGLTPIEARSLGVPSIITRDGGLEEAAGTQALAGEPGNWRELAGLLEQAAAMPGEEYARRGQRAQEELSGYLKPLRFYEEEFSLLVGRSPLGLPPLVVEGGMDRRPLRILLHSYVFAPNVGGIETVSDVMAGSWTREGHEVTVLTEVPAGNETESHSFAVVRCAGLMAKLKLILRHDLVHSNGASLRCYLLAAMLGKPFSWTHTAYQLLSVDGLGVRNGKLTPLRPWPSIFYYLIRLRLPSAIGGGAKLFFRRWVARRVQLNVQITHFMAAQCPMPRQMVIYNPIHSSAFAARDAESARRELEEAEATFSYLGRVVSEKGIDTLLHALALVHAEESRVPGQPLSTLNIVGTGRWKKHLQQLAKRLRVSEHVRWKGVRVGEALAREVRRMGIVIIPSLTAEPMGIVGLEMMTAGKPLIVSGPSGLSECVGQAGLCFPRGNAVELAAQMLRLGPNRDLQRELIDKGFRRSAEFDSRALTDTYLRELRRIRSEAEAFPS